MRSWIKLYTEILNDPKMGRLTDRQYRTCVNLFLLAGQRDGDGDVGDANAIAWTLRMSESDLVADLGALAAVGIVAEHDGTWRVVHFSERQERKPSDTPERIRERVQRHRDTKCNAPETPLKRPVTRPESESESESESDKSQSQKESESSRVCANDARQDDDDDDAVKDFDDALIAYETTAGANLGAAQRDELRQRVNVLSGTGRLADVIAAALRQLEDRDVRATWPYFRAVLDDAIKTGLLPGSGKRGTNGNGKHHNSGAAATVNDAAARRSYYVPAGYEGLVMS